MKLKLDENLGKGPRDIFIKAGHDVKTVAGQQMEGASLFVLDAATDAIRIEEFVRTCEIRAEPRVA
ncbi:MAG: hypothetical protein C4576_02990 [Desulfobacteraceae bacterium]|nr:MAG: hypothetical protein C4576_02990 [Desulfobacteraceae bacterium]